MNTRRKFPKGKSVPLQPGRFKEAKSRDNLTHAGSMQST